MASDYKGYYLVVVWIDIMLNRSARSSIVRIFAAVMITGSLFFLFNSHTIAATIQPGGNISNSAVLNIDIARIATVRIMTTYHATVRINVCDTHYDILQQDIQATGSGAFISAHGDILTADHVIDFPLSDLQDITMQILAPTIALDTTAMCNTPMTATVILQRYIAHPELFTLSYAAPVSIAWLDTSLVGPYTATSPLQAKSFPLHILVQSPYDKNDVAIVHASLTDTPSIPIGNSADVAPTDTLTIMGYPSNADLGANIDTQNATDFLTASLNTVYVSALKNNASGGALLQVGGNVEHGDSGGPAINGQGQLVGIISFGVAVNDPNDVGQTRFLQAAASVVPLIAQAQINTSPGPFQQRWTAAMRAIVSDNPGHWRQAATDFVSLQHDYPAYTGIDPYLAYVQAQHDIPARTDVLFLTQSMTLLIIGAAIGSILIVVCALIAIGIRVIIRRRKYAHRHRQASQPISAVDEHHVHTTGKPTQQSMYTIHEMGSSATPPQLASMTPIPSRHQRLQRKICQSGHRLRDNETYCPQCGAQRAA